MTEPTQPRRRNAVATRAAILASAREAFARAGYDGAGVREIAHGAGVTAMLVNRYFGSKERLFAEAITQSMTTTSVLTRRLADASISGEELAALLVEITRADATPLEGFQILLRSAASERAAQIGRESIEDFHQKSITAALGGNLPAQRAAVLISIVAGFQMMRQMIGLGALADAASADLVAVLGPLFQQLIDGERSN